MERALCSVLPNYGNWRIYPSESAYWLCANAGIRKALNFQGNLEDHQTTLRRCEIVIIQAEKTLRWEILFYSAWWRAKPQQCCLFPLHICWNLTSSKFLTFLLFFNQNFYTKFILSVMNWTMTFLYTTYQRLTFFNLWICWTWN